VLVIKYVGDILHCVLVMVATVNARMNTMLILLVMVIHVVVIIIVLGYLLILVLVPLFVHRFIGIVIYGVLQIDVQVIPDLVQQCMVVMKYGNVKENVADLECALVIKLVIVKLNLLVLAIL
jgi:hypothetical protein